MAKNKKSPDPKPTTARDRLLDSRVFGIKREGKKLGLDLTDQMAWDVAFASNHVDIPGLVVKYIAAATIHESLNPELLKHLLRNL